MNKLIVEELVDIVNERDEVIGNASKAEAHEKGLLHRTVIAEVIDSKGNFTLVKQAADRQDPGQYVSPVGGHVKSGETEDSALLREAAEEFGLTDPFPFRQVGKVIFNRRVRGKTENHYFILYEIMSDKDPVLNEESVGSAKFSKSEIRKQLAENPKKFGDAYHFVVKCFYPELLS